MSDVDRPATRSVATGRRWTEEGAETVVSGVHRVPLPLPSDALRAVNVYAVEIDRGVLLIDAGWAVPGTRAALARGLAEVGVSLSDISRCVVTHFHRDHYTFAADLRRELGIAVSLGVGEQPSLAAVSAPGAVGLTRQRRLLRLSGAEALARALEADGHAAPLPQGAFEQPDEWLEGQHDVVVGQRRLRVVPTPGHTRGHVVFADLDAKLLFAGDHVLPTITPSIAFEPASSDLPLADYLSSLRLTRALGDLRLLPAHGPVAPSTHARIDQLLAHHEARLALCATLVHEGLGTLRRCRRDAVDPCRAAHCRSRSVQPDARDPGGPRPPRRAGRLRAPGVSRRPRRPSLQSCSSAPSSSALSRSTESMNSSTNSSITRRVDLMLWAIPTTWPM